MLLLDTSGSMAGAPLESEKAAASEFLSLLPPEVRVGVVAYGSTPTLVAAPSTDRDAVTAGIAPLTADTDTALYDAVIFAAGQFTPEAERRAIVLLSDGEDNVSVASLEAATAAAAEIPVHVIELVTERSDRPTLDQLAAAGGGVVSSANDPAALTELYRQAAGTVANQYRITYPSSGSGPVELTVRVQHRARACSPTPPRSSSRPRRRSPRPPRPRRRPRRRRPHHRRPRRRRRTPATTHAAGPRRQRRPR